MKKLITSKNFFLYSSFLFITAAVIISSLFVTSTLQSFETEKKQAEEKLVSLLQEKKQLQEELQSLQAVSSNVTELEETNKDQQKNIEELEKTVELLEDEAKALSDEINELKNEINQLKEELETRDNQSHSPPQRNDSNNNNPPKDNSNNKTTKVSTDVNAKKKVFLTFDDGPTTLTPLVLNTLAKYQAPATFFVIGQRMERSPEIVQRAYREGHMILPHSYTHDWSIYTSFETFYDDFYLAEKAYKNVLGFETPPIFRFPGGSSNHSSFRYGGEQFMPMLTVDIKEKGYTYVDWNVSSGDAGPVIGNPTKMKESIFQQSEGKDFIVLLFHDTAGNSAMLEILPDVISFYKERDYAFRSFRDVTNEELAYMERRLISNKPIIR